MSEQQNEEETTQQEEQTEEQQEDQEEAKEGEGEGGDKKKEEKKEKPSIEDRRHRQYKKQLNKMQETLNEEKSKIVKPEYTPYTPYIWNSLTPYYETNTVQYLMDLPNEVRHGYINRNTAQGLVDPEVSHRMDIELDPVPNDIVMTPRDKSGKKDNNKKSKKKEGSTRLPKWPVVRMNDTDLNQEIDWSDVPKLREELRTKYSTGAQQRIKNDYTRTKQDWTRMDLDELKKVHPVTKSHMKVTCNAYLGTTPGSKRAVTTLSKTLDD